MGKEFYKCSNCGSYVNAWEGICSNCGSKDIKQECPKCKTLYDVNENKCPNCGYREKSMNTGIVILILLIVLLLICILARNLYDKSLDTINSNKSKVENTIEKTNMTDKTSIRVKPMIELSGKSVREILELRKNAVNNSPIASILTGGRQYKPNPRVYQIEDGLNWIGAYQVSCNGVNDNQDIGLGKSRESVGIINPEFLYYLGIPSYDSDKRYCSPADYLIPKDITYYKNSNTIKVTVNYSSLYSKRREFFTLYPSDTNARDFGYNYVYSNKFSNISFVDKDNIGNSINTTKGFYHKGYACGLAEGCNNYSPYDATHNFRIIKLPASINIKFWKKEPISVFQRADINYQIDFE